MRLLVDEPSPSTHAPDSHYARQCTQLRNSLNRYARLMRKADEVALSVNEFNLMFTTAIMMRNVALDLGMTNLQLQLMLEQSMRDLRAGNRIEIGP